MLNTLNEIMSAHQGHWFDRATLAFFNSKIDQRVYPTTEGTYFVSSEKDGKRPRKWSVRFCDLGGNISTVGEFQAYSTPERAHYAAGQLAS